jgi:glycerol-3-phosphate acyltransferase PlsX
MPDIRIGLDIMGGDHAPEACLDGAVLAEEQWGADVSICLYGPEDMCRAYFREKGIDDNRFQYAHSPEVIGMGENPIKSFQSKPQSSISNGFHDLAKGVIDGFCSAGNSGAMLVGAFYSVKTIPGVIRPCLPSVLPRPDGGHNLILDVGINADCKSDVLYQFGIMGNVYAEHILGLEAPRVALLNMGEEEGKGNQLVQSAFNLFKDAVDFDFVGNVEGRDMFADKADVIVCDGFTGNALLKQAEAFYDLLVERKIQDAFFDRFDYQRYGGTPVLGVNAPVIIGHGISNPTAVKNMIRTTKEFIDHNLVGHLKISFEK